ncbi:MAG: hypothetical protein RLZZ618_678 [Pseudomonadota bacterium]|jgi:tetratricopeptide (TPR) repeat protein
MYSPENLPLNARRCLLVWVALVFSLPCALPAVAAPYLPKDDAQVLEVLASRADDPRQQQTRAWRAALARDPRDLPTALKLAHRYHELVQAEGDPRYIGYAQAALTPWWNEADPPVDVRVLRAVILQFGHQFAPALADLQAAVAKQPDHVEAWAWLAAIHMVQADYNKAREACERFAPRVPPLLGVACIASADAVSGRAVPAIEQLQAALARQPQAPAAERLWALTRLAETQDRIGRTADAERTYRQALQLGVDDIYLQAAYADFLLDHQRAAEVLVLLKGKTRADVLLVRLALAAHATRAPALAAWTKDLADRFDAARRRGDTTHEKEEARFALHVLNDPAAALKLADHNYAAQKEPADARMLLEAATAARQPAAAEPVLAWMKASGIEAPALQRLAASLKGTP